MFFTWATPLFALANRKAKGKDAKGLSADDLWTLPEGDTTPNLASAFEKGWQRSEASVRKKQEASGKARDASLEGRLTKEEARSVFVGALKNVAGKKFLYGAAIVKVVNSAIQFSYPVFLSGVLQFVEGKAPLGFQNVSYGAGFAVAAALGVAVGVKAITENMYFHIVTRAGWQVRSAVSTAVYRKSLRLSAAARQQRTLGEMVNYMQIDANKLEMFVPQVHVLWDGLFQITGYMTLLLMFIGWPALIGLLVMIFSMPIQLMIMKRLFGLNRIMVKHTDARVKVSNEAMMGMQCLKMYSWEDQFIKKMEGHRKEEVALLKKAAYLRAFSRAYMGAVPVLVSVASFLTYAAVNGEIRASILFTALAAFGQLRFPLLFYPMAFAQLAQAKVSVARVADFLSMDEISSVVDPRQKDTSAAAGTLAIEGGEFWWADPAVMEKNRIEREEKEKKTAADAAAVAAKKGRKGTQVVDVEAAKDASKGGESKEGAVDDSGKVLTRPVLTGVNFAASPGQLVAVIGPVGSGKSSLCNALLGEMVQTKGSVSTGGTVAYASQTAWILNATVRENILFGEEFDEERYWRVISACELEHDMTMLPDGDFTMIGERGINLSGGQKQRISIARAAYARRDTVVLDDPLSALDPEVANSVFEQCIKKELAGTTRVLVTNQLNLLSQCDHVVVIGAPAGESAGTIEEQGTFDELVSKGLDFAELLAKFVGDTSDHSEEADATSVADGAATVSDASTEAKSEDDAGNAAGSNTVESNANTSEVGDKSNTDRRPRVPSENTKQKRAAMTEGGAAAKGLMQTEEKNVGSVPARIYIKYLRAAGGLCMFAFSYFLFILATGNNLISIQWVGWWSADATPINATNPLTGEPTIHVPYSRQTYAFYLVGYAIVAVALGVFTFFRTAFLAVMGVNASINLHGRLTESVMRAPTSFFDTTPIGRIVSRFSKDIHSMDEELTNFFDFFLFCSLYVLATMGTITFVTPWFGVAAALALAVYIIIINYFRQVSRESKRLESVARSPVYAHYSETLGGTSTIRAYGVTDRFLKENAHKMDVSIEGYYANKVADRWLSVRLELLGAFVGLGASLLVIVTTVQNREAGIVDPEFAGLAGLSLTYAISVTGLLNWTVRSFAQLEAAMNSTERIFFYIDNVPQEAAAKSATPPPKSWPDTGKIELNNLRMKYRHDTPMVLKGLNLTFEGGERVGIVGRTGSGKSSLLLCLLRLVEPEKAEQGEAPIAIDGVDVTKIGLAELRKKIAIIPQNPTLFSGTIRSNLDPFDEYTDDDIWHALEQCEMKLQVEGMEGQLQGKVSEYGENLSQGQRQLLCLGRAVLQQCRVLLLDEATSACDLATDELVQKTLRSSFAQATILTIAHRINTIIDNDKIVVLSEGLVAEYDRPANLLRDPESVFSGMTAELGPAAAAKLRELAGVSDATSEAGVQGACDTMEGKKEAEDTTVAGAGVDAEGDLTENPDHPEASFLCNEGVAGGIDGGVGGGESKEGPGGSFDAIVGDGVEKIEQATSVAMDAGGVDLDALTTGMADEQESS